MPTLAIDCHNNRPDSLVYQIQYYKQDSDAWKGTRQGAPFINMVQF